MSCFCLENFVNLERQSLNSNITNNKYIFPEIPKPNYSIKEIPTSSKTSSSLSFEPENYNYIPYPWLSLSVYQVNKTFTNKKVTILSLVNKNSLNNKTIIFSHGFPSELSNVLPFMADLASVLKCNFISYEYTDIYKVDQNEFVENVKRDLETVVNFTIDKLKIKINNLILMSSSLGSIPTISLAAEEEYQDVSGIILISPLSYGNCRYKSKEINYLNYDNSSEALNISSKVLLIHGVKNEKIPIKQSKKLSQYLSNVQVWFPLEGDNSNIIKELRFEFLKELGDFLKYLDDCNLDKETTVTPSGNALIKDTVFITPVSQKNELEVTNYTERKNRKISDVNFKFNLESYREYNEIENNFYM